MSIYKSATLIILSLALCGGQTTPPKPLTGTWSLEMAFPDIGIPSIKLELRLEQMGAAITGTATTINGGNPVKGTIDGSNVTFTETIEGGEVVFKGTRVNDNTMQGTVDMPQMGAGTWTAKR